MNEEDRAEQLAGFASALAQGTEKAFLNTVDDPEVLELCRVMADVMQEFPSSRPVGSPIAPPAPSSRSSSVQPSSLGRHRHVGALQRLGGWVSIAAMLVAVVLLVEKDSRLQATVAQADATSTRNAELQREVVTLGNRLLEAERNDHSLMLAQVSATFRGEAIACTEAVRSEVIPLIDATAGFNRDLVSLRQERAAFAEERRAWLRVIADLRDEREGLMACAAACQSLTLAISAPGSGLTSILSVDATVRQDSMKELQMMADGFRRNVTELSREFQRMVASAETTNADLRDTMNDLRPHVMGRSDRQLVLRLAPIALQARTVGRSSEYGLSVREMLPMLDRFSHLPRETALIRDPTVRAEARVASRSLSYFLDSRAEARQDADDAVVYLAVMEIRDAIQGLIGEDSREQR